MQSVKIGKLLRQLAVLISRNFQLIWNQKLTLGSLILQAPLMVLVIKLVGEPDCFTSNLINIGSRTVLFIVCAMASFMGLLNSYREICKDREIIFREASVGVSLLATVLSKAITLFLVEAVQAGILTAGFVEIIHIPQNHLLLDTNVEIFITIFLLMAASTAMGRHRCALDFRHELVPLERGRRDFAGAYRAGAHHRAGGVQRRYVQYDRRADGHQLYHCLPLGHGGAGRFHRFERPPFLAESRAGQPDVRCHRAQPGAQLADAGVDYPGVRGGGMAGAVYWVQSEKGIIGTAQSAFFSR